MSRSINIARALRGRRTILAVAVVPAALALAGCANFQTPPTGAQNDVIGSVTIHSAICVPSFGSGEPTGLPIGLPTNLNSSSQSDALRHDVVGDPPPTCGGNDTFTDGQLLVGYLVPDGATAPDTITSTGDPAVTLHQDPDYAQWLSTDPSGPGSLPGSHWVGYLSDEVTLDDSVVTLDPRFGIPHVDDGSAYAGPFSAEVAVGDRIVDATTDPADRTLDCNEATFLDIESTVSPTVCNDTSAEVDVNTDDLGIAAPQPVSVQAGQSATLPYTLSFAGTPDDTTTFALTGASDATGVAATPADASFSPSASGQSTENVSVAVPAGTAPGTYHVTLTAVASCADTSQCTRTATATVTVTAPPAAAGGQSAPVVATPAPPAPSPSNVTKPLRFSARLLTVAHPHQKGLFRHGWKLALHCNQACVVFSHAFVFHGGYYHHHHLRGHQNPIAHVLVGTRVDNLSTAGTRRLTLTLTPSAVAALHHAHMHWFRINLHLWARAAVGHQRAPLIIHQVRVRS
jgi:hypothetical protein